MTFKDAAAAIDRQKKVFGATEQMRMPMSGGKGVMHAEIKIGESVLVTGEPMPGMEVACRRASRRPPAV